MLTASFVSSDKLQKRIQKLEIFSSECAMLYVLAVIAATVPAAQGTNVGLQPNDEWGNWGMWSWCSCDFHVKERRRSCDKSVAKGKKCMGHEVERIRCDEECTKIRTADESFEFLYFRKIFLTHDEAELHCQRMNATLAVIKTLKINSMISEKIRYFHQKKSAKDRQYHIGLKQQGVGWRWSDGTVVPNRAKENETKETHKFEMWTERKNYMTKHKCAAMSKSYCRHIPIGGYFVYNCWEKLPCATRRPFICQRKTIHPNTQKGSDKKKRPYPCAKSKCKKVTSCPLLPIHYNGVSDPPYGGYDRFLSGDTVRFFCPSDQYQLVGNEAVRCLKNGSWSNDMPSCEISTDCDFSFGAERLCWYSHLDQPKNSFQKWYAVRTRERRNYAAYAWRVPIVIQSPFFTAKESPRCLIFKYKLHLDNPWLEVRVGNHTWMRAAFERRGDWHKALININQTKTKMRIFFHAKSGGVFLDDIKLLLHACRKYTIKTDNASEADTFDPSRKSSREAVECDFETSEKPLCEYTFSGGVRWMKREICRCNKLGHVARVSVYGETPSILQSPPFNTRLQAQCLRFMYMLQSPRFIASKLIVKLGNKSWIPPTLQKDKWFIAQINVTENPQYQRIEFIVVAGTATVDNITLDGKACDDNTNAEVKSSSKYESQANVIENLAKTLFRVRSTEGIGDVKSKKLLQDSLPWYSWSKWTPWSECTGDPPTSIRRRYCLGPLMDVVQCKGHKEETNRTRCPTEVHLYENHEFLFYKHLTLSHNKAMRHCCKLGGTLLKIRSESHHYEIQSIVRKQHEYSDYNLAYHIGLRRHGNAWRWPDLDRVSSLIPRYTSVVRPYEAWANSWMNQRYKCAALSSYECRQNLRYEYSIGRYETCWMKVNCTSQRSFICERAYNPCLLAKCKNGGSCRLDGDSFTCNCTLDFFGKHCEFKRYPCLSLPCLNGGVCRHAEHLPTRYECSCLSDFYGKNCEIELPIFRKTSHMEYMLYKSPTLSHAKSARYCKQFNGTLAMPKNRFAMDVISNEFRKRKDEDGIRYHIGLRDKKTGWKWEDGTRPKFNITSDFRSMCAMLRQEQCQKHWTQCFRSWYCVEKVGFLCQRDVSACSVPKCKNGGICIETVGNSSYRCKCPVGFGGKDCTEEQSPCASFPCQLGGTCIEKPRTIMGFSCLCPNTSVGRYCEIDKNPCLSSPCLHGGTCVVDTRSLSLYTCLCPTNTVGLNCEEDLTSCETTQWWMWKCRNGGTCVKAKDDYSRDWCLCPSGYTGPVCEIKITSDVKAVV